MGGLKEGDLYIERPADAELLAALRRCDYAYVLSSRQTGKTSLMLRTLRKLRAEGFRCAKVDLGALGTDPDPVQWYHGLAVEIAEAAGCGESFAEPFFAASLRRTPVQRFTRFLRQLLAASPAPLVLFIDEVEGFLKLPMRVADDFLAALRSLYNDRDREPLYRRLSFCLLGVCTPTELIRDERRTPFNVARAINLEDFSWESVRAGFLPVLGESAAAEACLSRVYAWSGGHPYLTHRLVEEVRSCEEEGAALSPELAEQAVAELFLGALGREHENFLEVERRLCLGPAHRVQRRLALYRALLRGERVPTRGHDPIQLELRIAGLVRELRPPGQPPHLGVRNRIFASVFDATWAPKVDPAKLDPALWMREQIERWNELGRKDAFVLRGEELLEAQRWADTQPSLEPACRDFLAASRRVDDNERSTRLSSLTVTILFASFTNFLLAMLLNDYGQHRGLELGGAARYLYGAPFVLCLPAGLLSDRLRIGPLRMLLAGLSFITAGSLCLLLDSLFAHRALLIAAFALILFGQTLQRPHHAVLFGLQYPRTDPRLDDAFVGFYVTINLGSFLGPLLGAAMFRQHGWTGAAATALGGACFALYGLGSSRALFHRASLPLREEPEESPTLQRRRRYILLLLSATMLLFWLAFNEIGRLFQEQVAASTPSPAPTDLATRDLLLQGLSSGTITALFVLGLAPLIYALSVASRRLRFQPSAPARIAIGLLVLAGLLGSLLGTPPGRAALLANYLILTLAELLIVPVSMSMTTALSTTKTLSTMMGGYYLVMGLGSWISGQGMRPSPAVLAGLALALAAAGALLSRRRLRLSASYPVLPPPARRDEGPSGCLPLR
ncbi:MAG: MFS transporter [Polyangia bacterium]